MRDSEIQYINRVIEEFFEKNSDIDEIQAKELMPFFVKQGIFEKDHRNGLPIRNILRNLDKAKQLNKIPYALARRKIKNTNWYFIRNTGFKKKEVEYEQPTIKDQKSIRKTKSREDSDEKYILDHCDEVLGIKGSRQHKFDFLEGDLHKDGKTRTKLPCDIYYESLNLVIEYNESQHTEAVKHFDKPEKLTVSGVHRGLQRKRYDELRRTILPQHGINVIDFFIDDFNRRSKMIKRDCVNDAEIIKKKLLEKGYLKLK
ncbi:MAG: hypothetical protein ACQETL_08640 [Bacteroidota bacterium]